MKRLALTLVVCLLISCATLVAQRGAAVGAAGGQQRQIAVFDRQGKLLKMVGDPGPAGALDMSPDGKRVAIARGGSILVMDLATGATLKATSGPGDTQPAFSPDGTRIAFQSSRTGSGVGLYQTLANGTGKEELLFGPIVQPNLTGWSPDGKYLAFQATDQTTGTSTDMYVLPLTGDRKPICILRTKAVELGGQISPDGRYVAYRSDESGRNEVYVRPFTPGANPEPGLNDPKWKISTDGSGGLIRWRDDGRELYFLASNGQIMATRVNTTSTFTMESAPAALFSTPPEFPLTGTPGAFGDISADGKTFLLFLPVVSPAAPR